MNKQSVLMRIFVIFVFSAIAVATVCPPAPPCYKKLSSSWPECRIGWNCPGPGYCCGHCCSGSGTCCNTSCCASGGCRGCSGGSCKVCGGDTSKECCGGSCITKCDSDLCLQCDGNGACESKCDPNQCKTCVDGECVSNCHFADCLTCDGSGGCESFCDSDNCETCNGLGGCVTNDGALSIIITWEDYGNCPNLKQWLGYTPTTNGCTGVPNNPAGGACGEASSFLGACNTHDECYSRCGSTQGGCDGQFGNNLDAVCRPLTGTCYASCVDWALIYNIAVELVGEGYWQNGQLQACGCCSH